MENVSESKRELNECRKCGRMLIGIGDLCAICAGGVDSEEYEPEEEMEDKDAKD